jgi:hypothetical protein
MGSKIDSKNVQNLPRREVPGFFRIIPKVWIPGTREKAFDVMPRFVAQFWGIQPKRKALP